MEPIDQQALAALLKEADTAVEEANRVSREVQAALTEVTAANAIDQAKQDAAITGAVATLEESAAGILADLDQAEDTE